jgi:hypothetical protein
VYISKLLSLLLLKATCPFGPGNVPAHAFWLIWITERLGNSRIAEVAKRKANLVLTWESNIPLILLLPIFVATILHQKNGLFTAVVFSIFKLTYPTPTTDER